LARRIDVSEDPALTARLPASRPARVVVTLNDRQLAGECAKSEGLPVGDDGAAIGEKFTKLTEPVLGPHAAAALREAVCRLDALTSIAELTALLRT
jgi:2-methylcitrate dehydratase PrpD